MDLKYRNEDETTEALYSIFSFHQKIASLCGDKPRYICVFGAGLYGKRCVMELQNRFVSVLYIADNDPTKWGALINGVLCIAPQDLALYKDCTLVIAAKKNPEDILDALREAGYPHVCAYDELKEWIEETTPLKWLDGMAELEGIDYASPPIQSLIIFFKRSMCELARCYEARLTAVEKA